MPIPLDYILVHKKGNQPANLGKVVWAQAKDKTVYGYNTHFLKGPLQGKDSWKICVCTVEILGFCVSDLVEDENCWSSYGDIDPVTGNKDFDSDVKQEWIDNIFMKYTAGKAGVYAWGKDENEIYLSLRESDGEPKFGRYDDYMGLQLVIKKETKKPCGQTIDLRVYENVLEDNNPDNDGDLDPEGNPYYYKTNKVGARIKFRTITCTGKAGDPC